MHAERSPQGAEEGTAELERRIRELGTLKQSRVSADSRPTRDVEIAIRRTIKEVFGEGSAEYAKYKSFEFFRNTFIEFFHKEIDETTTLLRLLASRLEEKIRHSQAGIGGSPERRPAEPAGPLAPSGRPDAPAYQRRVFVVHGHHEAAKQTVARLLEKLGFEPVILHEQPDRGRTIIEKLEDHSAEAAYAVVLLTADDKGGPKDVPAEKLRPRARQNVILELGLFLGKLGRGHVCPLLQQGVEIPSDYEGVVYVLLDDAGAWKQTLAREMDAAGLNVDLNKLK